MYARYIKYILTNIIIDIVINIMIMYYEEQYYINNKINMFGIKKQLIYNNRIIDNKKLKYMYIIFMSNTKEMCNIGNAISVGLMSSFLLFTVGYFIYNNYFKNINRMKSFTLLVGLFIAATILSYYDLCNNSCQNYAGSLKFALLLTVIILLFIKILIAEFASSTESLIVFIICNTIILSVIHKVLCLFSK